jgi:hypothetical protein
METITKNEDGTFIIDGKVYRAVKDLVTSPDANTKEAAFAGLMNGLERRQDWKNYPHSIFWFKNGTYMFEYDGKEKYFWCSYPDVWAIFEKQFNMEFEEIQSFLRDMMELFFKHKGVKANYASVKCSLRIEKHFKDM